MKRGGFKRKVYEPPRAAALRPIPPEQRRGAVVRLVAGPAAPVVKEEVVRSEAYRRLVAAMPCAHCGLAGSSQAAHPNTGKGAGMKTDDRLCFPLCADGPGRRGCHSRLDQGALFGKLERRARELEWTEQTVAAIVAAGQWPPGLPMLPRPAAADEPLAA